MPRALQIALPSLLLTLVLAACGGAGGGAGDADPATAVPAGTSIYLEGVVRPEGDQREDVLDAAGKVLRTDDPERKLRELVDKGLADSESGGATYEKDFAPWLGEKAGVWVAGVSRDKPGYVVVVAAKDTEKAQESLDKGVKRDGGKVTQRSYEGVDYQVDGDGVAAGIVGDFVAFGTEPEFKRTVKAQDGASLAEDKQFESTTGGLADERIGEFYVDLKPFIEQSLKADPAAAGQLEQIRSIFPFDQLEPMAGALLADGERIAFDSLTRGKGVEALKAFGPLTGTGTTPLLGELPEDAWVALGAPDVGASAKTIFGRAAGALGGVAATQQLQQRYGIDLERDVFAQLGDVALFVRDGERADVEGGLVMQVESGESQQEQTFAKLVALARSEGGEQVQPVKVAGADSAFRVASTDLDLPLVFARARDRFVLAYGPRAASAALDPQGTLAGAPLFEQGKALLGDDHEPSFLLSMPGLVRAAARMEDADGEFAKAKPYLEAFTVIASGGKFEGDEVTSRIAAGLK